MNVLSLFDGMSGWVVSDTQIYRMCGNGWTARVIEHILKNLFV